MKRDDATDTETRAAWRRQYAARFQLVMGRVSSPDVRRIVTHGVGEIPSLEYRLGFYYRDMDGSERRISPWHDVPIKVSRSRRVCLWPVTVATMSLLCCVPSLFLRTHRTMMGR